MMASDAPPRVGVIGLGSIGRTHIATWIANGVSPVAYADAVPAALEATIREHGGQGFDDGIALVRSGMVDIDSICTPSLSHKDLVIASPNPGQALRRLEGVSSARDVAFGVWVLVTYMIRIGKRKSSVNCMLHVEHV